MPDSQKTYNSSMIWLRVSATEFQIWKEWESAYENQIIQPRKLISFENSLGNLLKLSQCEKKYLQFHNEQVYLFNFVESTKSC